MELQAAYLGVGEETVRGQIGSQSRDLGPVPRVPSPGTGHGPHPLAITGQDGHDDLSQSQQRRLGQHARQVEARVALQHGPKLVPALEHLHGDRMTALVRIEHGQRFESSRDRLAVTHAGVGRDDHPRARHLRSPREVEILPHGHDSRIEALELAATGRP